MERKIALVTGSGKGFGRGIAEKLARDGARVIINDIDKDTVLRCIDDLEEIREQLDYYISDVSNEESVITMIEEVIGRYGRIDILVNNAGICEKCSIEQLRSEQWDRMFNINIRGMYLCSKGVVPHMKKKKSGRIINISSIGAKTGGLLVGAHYAASKAAVLGLTKSLARELAPFNITANAVAPGLGNTDMMNTFNDEEIERVISGIPLKRMTKVGDIANIVSFLASDEAEYITGQSINVDGGQVME